MKDDPVSLYRLVQRRLKHLRTEFSDPLQVTLGPLSEPFVTEAESRLAIVTESLGKRRNEILDFIREARTRSFPYIDVLRIAEAYVELRSCEVKRGMHLCKTKVRNLNTFKYDARQLLEHGNFVYWPTFESMNLKEFIRTRSVRLYALEVRETSVEADGSEMHPLLFLIHDKNHGREMALADARLVRKNGEKSALNKTIAAWSWISRRWSIADNVERAATILYSYSHENGAYNLDEILTTPARRIELEPQALEFIRTELNFRESADDRVIQRTASRILRDFLSAPPGSAE